MWRSGYEPDPISPGDVYGRLTALGGPIWRFKGDIPRWVCRCDCGEIRDVPRARLLSGVVNSCGCLKRDVAGALLRRRRTTHGDYKNKQCTLEYRAWSSMMTRCTNPNYCKWNRYGGRGISICQRWLRYQNFLDDMGRKPGKQYSLDRINNDGDYEPGNCRWATPLEQSNNRSSCIFVEWDGRCLTIKQWAKALGLKPLTLSYRLKQGWPISEALTSPLLPNGRSREQA